MTMTEFKNLVKDTGMETRDLKFEVMQNMFKKANSNHTNAIAKQRKEGRLDATSKQEARKSKDGGDKTPKKKKVRRRACSRACGLLPPFAPLACLPWLGLCQWLPIARLPPLAPIACLPCCASRR